MSGRTSQKPIDAQRRCICLNISGAPAAAPSSHLRERCCDKLWRYSTLMHRPLPAALRTLSWNLGTASLDTLASLTALRLLRSRTRACSTHVSAITLCLTCAEEHARKYIPVLRHGLAARTGTRPRCHVTLLGSTVAARRRYRISGRSHPRDRSAGRSGGLAS
jgi:hypothetical protein